MIPAFAGASVFGSRSRGSRSISGVKSAFRGFGSHRSQWSAEADAVHHAIEPKSSVSDEKSNVALIVLLVEVGEFSSQVVGGLARKVIEPAKIVVTVPFHVRHTELGLKTEILLQGDASEVGEVFSALEKP